VGLNVVEEKRLTRESEGRKTLFKQVFELDFGHCRLALAAPDSVAYDGPSSLENTRIATSYVGLLNDYLKRNEIKAEAVYFSGAVEIAPKLGRAEYICDLVSSGGTLKANGLEARLTIADISSRIIVNRASMKKKHQLIQPLLDTLAEAVGAQ